MKKLYTLLTGMLVLSLVSVFVLSCAPTRASSLKVVTSTSLLASVVERVGGDKVEVTNIILPAQCPGHFDVKPGDIKRLAQAELFLMHGWQGEKFSQELIASANNPDLTVVKIEIIGNWMTPQVQSQAIDKITAAICQVDAENTSFYQTKATAYKDKILAKEAEIKAKLKKANPSRINVICAEIQTGFLEWAGLNIVATYGRPDSLTPRVIKELVDKGKEAGVSLIIDNLQSGQDAGAAIAEELQCSRIVLSNFPGGFENTETWEKAIDRNIKLILDAVANVGGN